MEDPDLTIGYWLNMIPYVYIKEKHKIQRVYLIKQKDILSIRKKYHDIFQCMNRQSVAELFQFVDIEDIKLLRNGEVRINGILMMSSLNGISTDLVWKSLNLEYPEKFPDLLDIIVEHRKVSEDYLTVLKKYDMIISLTHLKNIYENDIIPLSHDHCSVCPYIIGIGCDDITSPNVSNIESNFLNSICNTSRRYVFIFVKTEYDYCLLVIDKLYKQIITYGLNEDVCKEAIINFIDISLPLYFDYSHKIIEYDSFKNPSDKIKYLQMLAEKLSSKPYKHILAVVDEIDNEVQDNITIDNQSVNKKDIYETYVSTIQKCGDEVMDKIKNGGDIVDIENSLLYTDPNYISSDGSSPLSLAICLNRVDVIKMLKLYNADFSQLRYESDLTLGSTERFTKLSRSFKHCNYQTWKTIVSEYATEFGKYSNKVEKIYVMKIGDIVSALDVKKIMIYTSIISGLVLFYYLASDNSYVDFRYIYDKLQHMLYSIDSGIKSAWIYLFEKIESYISLPGYREFIKPDPVYNLTEDEIDTFRSIVSQPISKVMNQGPNQRLFYNILQDYVTRGTRDDLSRLDRLLYDSAHLGYRLSALAKY